MKGGTTVSLKAAICVTVLSFLASSGCSHLPAQKLNPAGPNLIRTPGYRVRPPPGGGWSTTQDPESGTVVFSKKWGGFGRELMDTQQRVWIEVTPVQVPSRQWSLADEDLASSIMDEYAKQNGILNWMVLECGEKKLRYLRESEFIDGDEESTGLAGMNDEPIYIETSFYGLYFPPDLGKSHRYFEIFLRRLHISSFLAPKNPEPLLLQTVVRGLDTVAPFEDTPGPTGDLLRAAIRGDREQALEAIDGGADIDAVLPDWTPPAVAAYCDQPGIASLLVREGGDADAAGGRPGLTPLLVALLANHPEVAGLLLERGADGNKRSEDGYSALMIAAACEFPDLASLLIERGANVDARSKDGRTPLMLAAQSGSTGAAAVLLESGAAMDIQANDGGTALIRAVDWQSREIARLLMQSGADIDIRDDEGWSALLVAILQGDSELVDELVGRGADINANVYETGQTALLLAFEAEEFGIARTLIESGADLNRRRLGDWTPLMVATGKGQSDLVRLMIEKGADVNVESDDRQTALIVARKNGRDLIADLLVKAGAKK